jgi:hypothetical protein
MKDEAHATGGRAGSTSTSGPTSGPMGTGGRTGSGGAGGTTGGGGSTSVAGTGGSTGTGGAGGTIDDGGATGRDSSGARDSGTPCGFNEAAFCHPGVLNARASLDFVKAKILAGAQPWKQAFDQLASDRLASLSRAPSPRAIVECGSYSMPDIGCEDELFDAAAAYANALLFYLGGDAARAKKAIEYMNAWARVLRDHTNSNAPLQAGWSALNWTKAAEIIRYSDAGWSAADVVAFRNMLVEVYYPLTKAGSSANGNWELTMIDANIGIGVFADDRAIALGAVAMWRGRVPAYVYLASDGPMPKAPPGRNLPSWYSPGKYVDGLTQETCRDLSHTSYGLADMVYTAETARIQGVDLYGEESARIRAGYEFNVALQQGGDGGGICGGSIQRDLMSFGELAYNHYAVRNGIAMPNTLAYLKTRRPTAPQWHALVWETITHAEIGDP